MTAKEMIMEQAKLREIMGHKDYTLSELKVKYKALYGPESATPSNKVMAQDCL